MTTPLDYFDRIVCINLDERPDRWQQMQETTAPLLGKVRLERLPAVKPDLARLPVHNGRAGCLLSHRRAIEAAYRDGLQSVLVFEDDVRFHESFQTHAPRAFQTLEQTEWELFYLGFTPQAPLLPAGDGLVRTYGGITTHAIAYHRRAMPGLLRRLPDESGVLRFLSRYKSVDRYYWQHAAPALRCYAARPLLAFQRDDFSDIQQDKTTSNREQAERAFTKRLVEPVTPITGFKLRAGLALSRVKAAIDGPRRMMRHPARPK